MEDRGGGGLAMPLKRSDTHRRKDKKSTGTERGFMPARE